MHRRHAPSSCNVVLLRRHASSSCFIVMHRHHAPSSCNVAMLRRHASSPKNRPFLLRQQPFSMILSLFPASSPCNVAEEQAIPLATTAIFHDIAPFSCIVAEVLGNLSATIYPTFRTKQNKSLSRVQSSSYTYIESILYLAIYRYRWRDQSKGNE